MRREQLLGRQPEMQRAGRRDLQAIIVDRHTNGATSYRIVTMAERVRQRLAYRRHRVEWLVDPHETVRFDTSGDGQGIAQEALGVPEKREGVAVELPVVEKLGAVDPAETGNAKQALRHLELDAPGIAEQHHCGAP